MHTNVLQILNDQLVTRASRDGISKCSYRWTMTTREDVLLNEINAFTVGIISRLRHRYTLEYHHTVALIQHLIYHLEVGVQKLWTHSFNHLYGHNLVE